MWSTDDGEHEGWPATIAPDGRIAASSSGACWFFQGVTGKYPLDESNPGQEVVPDAEIVGWHGACTCGWRAEPFTRAATQADADLDQRSDYVPFEEYAGASHAVTDLIYEEWRAHIAPVEAIHGVKEAAREHRQAGIRLDKSVAAAKAAGASWADIGSATGMSRQSAHERWSNKE